MPNIPINLTGPSSQHRSSFLSDQVTRNFYPEKQDVQGGKSNYVLNSFPGLKIFGTANGTDRGMHNHNGTLYKVTGTTLYSVNNAGKHTFIGTIPGNSPCVFSGIVNSLVVVTAGTAYLWNGTTLAQITDSDLESPNAVAHLNNQMIYDGDNGRFVTSDVGDATSVDGLNYATAESHPDSLVRPYVFNQILYLFGTATTETWYNSGVGSPPFDRIEGGIIPEGLAALHSVANNDKYLYFLGDDGSVHKVIGSNAEHISTIALSNAIRKFTAIDDAIGFCFKIQSQNFYYLTFPSANRSFCYSEDANDWFDLASGVGTGRHVANSYAYAFRKHLVSDYSNGNIYELDLETYDENGSPIQRVRDTAVLHGGLAQAPGKLMEMSRFELIMEKGVGILTGQGSEPVVMLQFSDDGGNTWSTEMWGMVGKMADFIYKVEWHVLGSFYNRIIRIKTSDPVFYSIHSASADLEVGL